jgi:hypothetical protein
VALRTAFQHPDAVSKLIVVSAAFRRDCWYPEILARMSQMHAKRAETFGQTPM